MYQNLKKKTEGFTIIEVLIVLAIAGLIMVIVFIAVPNIQRGQRNESRNNDARLIANVVNECLTNRNGDTNSCNAAAEISVPANLRELVAVTPGNGTGGVAAAQWAFNSTCDNTGARVAGTSPRQFSVQYQVETATGTANRCVAGG